MLYITETDYNLILKHCKKSLPNEACGLIAGIRDGNNKYIKKIYPLTNIDASSRHFSMDYKEQFATIKDIRANGYILLGNFHSHPHSPAIPSSEDRRLAYDTSINYMIISLMNVDKPVFNVFNINYKKDIITEKLIILHNA